MSCSNNYYLVEDFDPAFDYGSGIVVALNPVPMRLLDQRNIPYRIMEEFYSEKELRANEEAFFHEELSWIGRLDVFLRRNIPECERHHLDLARIYYNRLKFFADSYVIQARIFDAFVKNVSCQDRIVYIRKRGQEQKTKTMHHFKFEDEERLIYASILPRVCERYGVRYEYHEFDCAAEENGALKPLLGRKSRILKANAPLKNFLKRLQHVVKYEKWLREVGSGSRGSRLKVLFIHSGSYFLDPVIREFVRRGVQVYCRDGEALYEVSSFSEKKKFDLHLDEQNASLANDCRLSWQRFSEGEGEFLQWINHQCGIDVSDFVRPYFQSFIEDKCYELLMTMRGFLRFYVQENIDYVMTHTSSDTMSKSAILAAQRHPQTKTVCLQHCCDVFIDRVMHLTEVDPFDFFLAAEGISEEKFKQYAQEAHIRPCEVYQAPHYMNVVKSRCRRQGRGRQLSRKERILYIPTKLTNVHIRYFNCMVYPILWYLDYQKKLFEFFGEKCERFQFVYKAPVARAKFIQTTVIPHLEEKKYPNISIDARLVMDCLRDADRVILDRPTTALYEAHMSGLPVLCLYPGFIENMVSEENASFFGPSLQRFSSNEEAIAKVDEFLNSDGAGYRKKLPIREDNLVRLLTQKKRERMFEERPAPLQELLTSS